ncbi:hypothetical protein ACFLUZ_03600 [Chloroflexota bacterium]
MKLPANYEICLSILILRTLNLSQDAVASMVRCGKSTVVEVEQRIRTCPLDEAINLCDDQAIQGLVGREFPGLEEISGDILVKAGKLHREDILRHYREDFIVQQPGEDPLSREAKDRHTLELRSTLTEWMNQLPPPSKLPYAMKVWLTDEIPREWLYEISEPPDTAKLFDDALEDQEETLSPSRDFHLPIENTPAFANLLTHLTGHSIVGDIENLKEQSMKLTLDYGIMTGAIIQIISSTDFQQRYKQQLSTLNGYSEVARVVKASRTASYIIGAMLSCDLFALALTESSESFRIAFAKSLRETRAGLAIALACMVRDSSKLGSDLTNLAMILWDDSTQVQARVQDLLKRVKQLQQFYDELQTPFQLLLNEYPFPGKCSSCPD